MLQHASVLPKGSSFPARFPCPHLRPACHSSRPGQVIDTNHPIGGRALAHVRLQGYPVPQRMGAIRQSLHEACARRCQPACQWPLPVGNSVGDSLSELVSDRCLVFAPRPIIAARAARCLQGTRGRCTDDKVGHEAAAQTIRPPPQINTSLIPPRPEIRRLLVFLLQPTYTRLGTATARTQPIFRTPANILVPRIVQDQQLCKYLKPYRKTCPPRSLRSTLRRPADTLPSRWPR